MQHHQKLVTAWNAIKENKSMIEQEHIDYLRRLVRDPNISVRQRELIQGVLDKKLENQRNIQASKINTILA